MHVGQILQADCANGIGIRLSLFVSGCTNHCRGCFNEETWDFNYGREWTPGMEQDFIEMLGQPYYDGMSILGGEPFEPANQKVLVRLIRRVREEMPEKTIWVYTGFVYDKDLVPGGRKYTEYTDEMIRGIDILVDGPYVEEKKNVALNFRGSENQRIIDMKKTLEQGKIVLSKLNG